MGVIIIFIVHAVEAVLHWNESDDERFNFVCKVSMAPFFFVTCFCTGDGRDLKVRGVFCVAYAVLTIIEVAVIMVTALGNLINADALADECR